MFGIECIQFLIRNGSFVSYFVDKIIDKRMGRNGGINKVGYILVKVKFNFTGY